MAKDLNASIIKLSKKNLGIFHVLKLYNIFTSLARDDIAPVKLFLDNYYNCSNMPEDFYKMFLYCINSDMYKQLFVVLLTKDIYDLIRFLKSDNLWFEGIDILLEPKDYFNLSSKQINYIKNLIEKLNLKDDELEIKDMIKKDLHWLFKRPWINTEQEHLMLAIKMFMSVGLDNSIDILTGKYGLVDYEMIYYLFSNLNVKNRNSKISMSLNDFLFSNKKDPNNNMKLMLEGQFLELFINFDYFYNSLDSFIEKLGTKLNKSKVSILLRERYLSSKIESPELSGDLLDDMISSYYNKYGLSESESYIIDKNMEAYNSKLKTKTKSSIIQTDIPRDGEYTFELLPLGDIRNLVMGYRAGNCFRLNGDAFILFNKFLTNPHMRIMSISTDEYKDFGMVLLMRNGNALIAQGIELSKRVPDNLGGEKLYNAVKDAIIHIMDKMNNSDDEIVASIIGLSNNNTVPYNRNILPFLINPILEGNQNYYNGIYNYQALLALKDGKSIRDIKLFIPEDKYHDTVNKVYKRDRSTLHDSVDYLEIEKILISLRYAKFKKTDRIEMIDYYKFLSSRREAYTICTLDWFITVFQDGTIDSFVSSNDPLVLEQHNSYLEKVNKKGIKIIL